MGWKGGYRQWPTWADGLQHSSADGEPWLCHVLAGQCHAE